jgi:hypothetical protein
MEEVTIGEVMRAWAADCVKHAKTNYSLDLDYSVASLDLVDHMVADRRGGALIDPSQLTPDEEQEWWNYCKMIGGYVGEVIIRNLGGTWLTKELDSGSACIKLLAAGRIEGSPPDSVWRTLTEPYRSMASYYRSLGAVLDRS